MTNVGNIARLEVMRGASKELSEWTVRRDR
jgi:hypothetical protein